MSVNENTRIALREMGLNAYEIDAYIVLLEGGQMTAMEISQVATVPYSKMYEVLNQLKEKGWIKSSETRPFKYYPVPPLEATRFTKLRLEDKYLNWENTVAENLQPLYEKRELVERPDMRWIDTQLVQRAIDGRVSRVVFRRLRRGRSSLHRRAGRLCSRRWLTLARSHARYRQEGQED